MAINIAGVVTFKLRDFGYYEDDPDYLGEGTVEGATVKIAMPLQRGMSGEGRYKVTIKIEKEPDDSPPDEGGY